MARLCRSASKTIDTFGLTGRVTWRPSELTTVDLSLSTGLDETASAEVERRHAIYDARLDVSHDLREYLTIHGGAGVDYEDFRVRMKPS